MKSSRLLPPFQADISVLAIEPIQKTRVLSTDTINLLVLALNEMHYNRYWTNSGINLTPEQISAKNELVDRAILEVLLDTDPEIITETITDIVDNYIGGGVCSDENEGEEMPYILRLNGQAYLVDNCGCGDSELFALTKANTTNGVISTGNQLLTDGPGMTFNNPVPALDFTCYQNAAVNYLITRIISFHEAIVDLALQGLDFITGLDEVADWILLLVDILNGEGDLPDLAAISKAQVATVMTSDAVTVPLKAAWTYNDSVSRQELWAWADAAPVLESGVLVKALIRAWVNYSLIYNYNQRLEVLASECASGLSAGGGGSIPLPGGGYYQELDLGGGVVYPVIKFTNPVTLWNLYDTYEIPAVDMDVIAVEMIINVYGPGDSAHKGKIKLWEDAVDKGTTLELYVGANPNLVQEMFYTDTEAGVAAAAWNASARLINIADTALTGTLTLDYYYNWGDVWFEFTQIALIGEAL